MKTRISVLLIAVTAAACGNDYRTPPADSTADSITANGIVDPPGVQTIDAPFSFARAPFVHPRIVEDLSTWASDTGEHVVAVNLTDSNESNRYHGDVRVSESTEGCPHVSSVDEDGWFSYRYVGMTDSGVHVVETRQGGGGSLVSVDILFVTLELDYGLSDDPRSFNPPGSNTYVIRQDRERIVLRKLGTTVMGDRWAGDLAVQGNVVLVEEDRGWFAGAVGHSQDPRPSRRLEVDASPMAPVELAKLSALHPILCLRIFIPRLSFV